jgi:ADP-heptose:LPS heptosyltransferase
LEITVIDNQWDLLRKITKIRREGYDLALGFSQIGSYCAKISNANLIVDFDWVESGRDYSVIQLCFEVLKIALRQLNMNLSVSSPKTDFWYLPQDEQMVAHYLGELYSSNRPLVAVHCGGHHFNRKRWPVESFVELAEALRKYYGCEVFCIGGTEDLEAAETIRSSVPGVKTTAGDLTLSQTAALLTKCRLMIGNDSGPLHLSVAVNTPTIGLFGPTHPSQFYPYNPQFHRFIYKPLPCSPCYRFGGSLLQHVPRCSRAYCMETITVVDVLEQFETLFSQKDRMDQDIILKQSGAEPANRS